MMDSYLLDKEAITSSYYLIHDIPAYTSVNDLLSTLRTLREDGIVPDNTMILADNVEENIASVHLCQFGDLVHTELIGNYPTHALWICKTERAFNVLRESLQREGLKIFNNYNIFEFTRVTPAHANKIQIVPKKKAIENPSEIAKFWKTKCPMNEEVELYEHIYKKNDAALCQWINIYYERKTAVP